MTTTLAAMERALEALENAAVELEGFASIYRSGEADAQSRRVRKAIPALRQAIEEVKKQGWQPIENADRRHQVEVLGYDPDVGQYNMHWRNDENHWCYTWNHWWCNPTHWMPLPQPPQKDEGV